MKERPILFSGEMVRAILDGRKTQTRRVVVPQPSKGSTLTRMQCGYADGCLRAVFAQDYEPNSYGIRCRHGQPGDRLWVKETWGLMRHTDPTDWFRSSVRCISESDIIEQFALEHRANWKIENENAYWRPSIYMPRWASRLTLEITGVRVERLQEISEDDAKAEGVQTNEFYAISKTPHASAFGDLWESIYGNWDANPWAWVIEFKRINA